jgi:hypothetical protein
MPTVGPALAHPPRIEVRWGGELARVDGYREAPFSARHSLTLRWSAFHWFHLFMTVASGVPLAAMALVFLGRWQLGWVAVAAMAGYWTAAVLFNHVEVRVDGDRITSRLTPIPIWPSKSIPVAGITGVVASQSMQTRDWSEATNVGWYVVAILGDVKRPITRHLRTREEAVFVARTLEEQLGLSFGAERDDDGSDEG